VFVSPSETEAVGTTLGFWDDGTDATPGEATGTEMLAGETAGPSSSGVVSPKMAKVFVCCVDALLRWATGTAIARMKTITSAAILTATRVFFR
jgi:hypothetical protein